MPNAEPDEPSPPPIDWAAVRERRDRRRARRRVIGGVAGAVMVAAASAGVWSLTGDEEKPPEKHTAKMPRGFGEYRLAGKGESLWERFGKEDNLDPAEKTAHASYLRADGKKSFAITLDLDPGIDVSDPGEDDDAVSAILGTSVASGEAKSYAPGRIGGKLRCVEYAVAKTTSSRCVWGSEAATVTAQPVVTSGPRPTPGRTAAETRSFLAALRIRAVPAE
ncbi:hypothetical protein [Streptomyces sp. NPDC048172]|uniref:hypothetical protein n=1 Tax=Streptomyces sp. NPDC048172 TaxID=3365505 RepID=UPI003714FE9C